MERSVWSLVYELKCQWMRRDARFPLEPLIFYLRMPVIISCAPCVEYYLSFSHFEQLFHISSLRVELSVNFVGAVALSWIRDT